MAIKPINAPLASAPPKDAPMLWGHPLPTWTGPGGSLEFHGCHWDDARYTALVGWLGECTQILRTKILVPDGAMREAADREVRATAQRLRWEKASPSKPMSFAQVLDATRRGVTLDPTQQQLVIDLVESRQNARESCLQAQRRTISPRASSSVPIWGEVLFSASKNMDLIMGLVDNQILPQVPKGLKP